MAESPAPFVLCVLRLISVCVSTCSVVCVFYYAVVPGQCMEARVYMCVCLCVCVLSQVCDEDPYKFPDVDVSQWFTGGHLGTHIQSANWQVVNVTTPANYFHVLRRQVRTSIHTWQCMNTTNA